MRGTFKFAFFDLSSTNPKAHVHAAIARFEAVAADLMRPVERDKVHYTTQLAAIVRKRPEVNRKTEQFLRCLLQAHGHDAADG